MANEKRLIDANAFEEKLKKFIGGSLIQEMRQVVTEEDPDD